MNHVFHAMRPAFGLSSLVWSPLPIGMPVAGIDEERASSILFALRQNPESPTARQAATEWLVALQVSQIASDRLLSDMSKIADNLSFWEARMRSGNQLLFLLFSMGPLTFIEEVQHRLFKRAPGLASDQIEQRVMTLRTLQGHLAHKLATLNTSAGQLLLSHGSGNWDAAVRGSTPAPDNTETGALDRTLSNGSNVAHSPLERDSEQQASAAASHTREAVREVLTSIRRTAAEISEQGWREPDESGSHLHHMGSMVRRVIGRREAKMPSSGSAGTQGGAEREGSAEEKGLTEGPDTVEASLGVQLDTGPSTSVHAALQAVQARRYAVSPLLRLPSWLQAPSHYQRNWIAYSAAAALCGWGLRYLYRHSWLAGSNDIEVWTKTAVEASLGAYQDHVLAPLLTLRDELFNTFHARRSIVTVGEYESDRDSLMRMLADFQTDNASKVSGGGAGGATYAKEAEDGMGTVMALYEDELKKPIRNLVTGQLARSLLIQVQKLKVDTESAMLAMDQILRANELSLALVAATPAALLLWGIVLGIWRFLSPAPPDPHWEAAPFRLAMVEVEQQLGRMREGGDGTSEDEMRGEGMLLFLLAQAYQRACSLFRKHPGLRDRSEWGALRSDLLDLLRPSPPAVKRRVCKRMMRAYSVLQP